MATQASPKLAPASAGVHDGRGPERPFTTPVPPLDDASRRAGATDDLGANPPGDEHPQQDLARVKAGLQAATTDLERLRGRLLNALNKGLVLHELGEILDRLEDLWQSIPDAPSDRRPPPTDPREANASPATGQALEIPA